MTQADELVIRPLTDGDHDQWRELWAGYLAYYHTSLGASVYDHSFARLIDPDDTALNGLVAEIDGELVGLVHYILHDHCWKPEGVVYLQDLFTRRDQRQRGIARFLIEAVYKEADEIGRPTVYWLTQDFNVNARALYDQVAEHTPFVKYQRG